MSGPYANARREYPNMEYILSSMDSPGAPIMARSLQKRLPGKNSARERVLEILVVEDNRGDSELLRSAFSGWESETNLAVVEDGEQALLYVHQVGKYAGSPRPDLILLDLNLPRRSGIEVLTAIKSDPGLQQIPVVVLTTSDRKEDVANAYRLHANSYLTKTVDVYDFFSKIRALEEYWLSTVRLPSDNLVV